ncbi:MAG: hypothetical protein M3209_20870 [Acidobacteriota bacterium]|nr:hypothetical protein [Acidobacteriota bacterium]
MGSVASSADGTKLVAVVSTGQIYINTPNPAVGYITGTANANVELQYVGAGKFKIILASGGSVTLF